MPYVLGLGYLCYMKEVKIKDGNLWWGILREKCPNCNKGKVFEDRGIFRMPGMPDNCKSCDFRFDREPGYFLGAMYISYALAVFEAIVTFLICYFFFPQMPIPWIPVAIISVMVLCARKNYKLSRIVYMHLFPW